MNISYYERNKHNATTSITSNSEREVAFEHASIYSRKEIAIHIRKYKTLMKSTKSKVEFKMMRRNLTIARAAARLKRNYKIVGNHPHNF